MKSKILIVDDNRMIVEFLHNFLSDEFEVVSRNSPSQALLDITKINPDMILLDQQFEGDIDGLTLLKNIKTSGFLQHIPVIMLTGKQSSEFRIEALLEGAEEVLSKPFNPMELKVRMQRFLSTTLQRMAS